MKITFSKMVCAFAALFALASTAAMAQANPNRLVPADSRGWTSFASTLVMPVIPDIVGIATTAGANAGWSAGANAGWSAGANAGWSAGASAGANAGWSAGASAGAAAATNNAAGQWVTYSGPDTAAYLVWVPTPRCTNVSFCL